MKKYIIITLSLTIIMFLVLAAQEKDTLLFSHKYHVMEEEMECADCHAVDQSITGMDNLLPAKEVCADCHDVNDEESCNTCHSSVTSASGTVGITEYSQLFSHETHVQANLECAACHGDVAQIDMGDHFEIPDMMECMDCHQTQTVANECLTCHTPEERLKPLNHDLAFLKTHGNIASNSAFSVHLQKDCATCHKTQFCQDCHEGENIDRFVHPLNFEFTHALSAQGREKNCFTCHDNREYCSSCHLSNDILPHNHTAGWTNNIPGDGGRHKIEAMIDLENCMSCHDHNADQICQQCHTN